MTLQAAWRQHKGIRMDRAAAAIQRLRAEVERKRAMEASLRAAVMKAYASYGCGSGDSSERKGSLSRFSSKGTLREDHSR